MSTTKIQGYPKVVSPTPVALHDGTNVQDHAMQINNFQVQVPEGSAIVGIGGSGMTVAADGTIVQPGQTIDFEAPSSRGTSHAFDLSKIYYVGGPFTLILHEKV